MSLNSFVLEPPKRRLFRLKRGSKVQTIAIVVPSYNMERVSYLIPSTRHQYIKLPRLPLHRFERHSNFLEQTPFLIGSQVDLVHTWNQLPLNQPFVVSAEMELPRYLFQPAQWKTKLGYRLLSSSRCRGVWPLSDAADNYIRKRLIASGHAEVAQKMTVFRGAVPDLLGAEPSELSQERSPLRLLFVGGDGLRKGLGPTLSAVQKLRKLGVDVTITVVSQPTKTTYIVPGAVFPSENIERILASADGVTHYRSLPNAKVRQLMRQHDLFVLPTMDESLGWVFVETGMSGLPSITTNVFAIPEMVVNGVTGWTIDMPLDSDRRWIHIDQSGSRDAWETAQAHIESSLVDLIGKLAVDRARIKEFGARARERTLQLYGVDAAITRLEQMYSAAIR